MPAIALLSPEVWEALKLANIRGATDSQLASQFEVSQGSIRLRRMRDPMWAAAMVKSPTKPTDNKEIETRNETAALVSASVQEMLRSNGETSSLRASQIASRSLERAPDELPVTSLGDVKVALQIARTAAGLDKAQVNMAVAMSPGWGATVTAECHTGDWIESCDSGESQE